MKSPIQQYKDDTVARMVTFQVIMFWFAAGVFAYAVYSLLFKRFLSIQARERRRRSRSYRPAVGRRDKPAVKLAVKVPKD